MSVSAVSAIQPSGMPDSLVPRLASENTTTADAAFGKTHLHMFAADDDTPSFGDLLDVINPLQHIPIINDIYREVTGDNKIGVGARLVGGALFGGVLGLIGSAINAVVEEATGHDVGGHIIALFKDDEPASSGTALASTAVPNPAAEPAVAATAPTTPKPAITQTAATVDMPKDEAAATAKPILLPDLAAAGTLAETAPAPAKAADASVPPPPAAAPQAPVTAVEGKPMPLWGGRAAREMPVPPRNTPIATRSPPALGMATSSTGTRSNTPVTGARTYQPPLNPALVQEMAANQADAKAGTAASSEWFSTAMMDGLAKYQRNTKLGQASAGSVSDSQ